MVLKEEIDFSRLTSTQFEELCFDLVTRLGYKDLTWHRGGADSGRDIEGKFYIENPIIGGYDERWFFECKNHTQGVPPEKLASKIAWCDSEKPEHLVFFISSYLTNGARQWLDKIIPQKSYKIHVVEGEALKRIISGFHDLVSTYFAEQTKLFYDLMNMWHKHGVLPEPEALKQVLKTVDPEQLSKEEVAFLWCSSYYRGSAIEGLLQDERDDLSLDFLIPHLIKYSSSQSPVIPEGVEILPHSISSCTYLTKKYESGLVANIELVSPANYSAREKNASKSFLSQISSTTSQGAKNLVLLGNELLDPSLSSKLALYTFLVEANVWALGAEFDENAAGIEVLIEQSSDFNIRIRYLDKNCWGEFKKMDEKISMENWKAFSQKMNEEKTTSNGA